jgi:hypothetical protein
MRKEGVDAKMVHPTAGCTHENVLERIRPSGWHRKFDSEGQQSSSVKRSVGFGHLARAEPPARLAWFGGMARSEVGVTDTNPTTMRFSRRLGDACRGSDYARSIEFPVRDAVPLPRTLVVALVVLALLAAIA